MEGFCWPYFDPEYDNFSQRINPPRVVIDNQSDDTVSLVKIDSANRHGILLEVVQVLTDLDLNIQKAYVSSDGGWFMDVFHVTDRLGNRITDKTLIAFIEQSLGANRSSTTAEAETCLSRTMGAHSTTKKTAIELTGTDRPGLLSEISAVLTNLKCNVVAAEMWTHNARVACILYLTEESTNGPVQDTHKLFVIKEQLCNVLKGNGDEGKARMELSVGLTHTDRRLHQIMLADCDYELSEPRLEKELDEVGRPHISIENCLEKKYFVINIHCKDRPKLLFDIVCTLTDMQYVVFHASIHSDGPNAAQEYYIRHLDRCTLDRDDEKQRVIKCLEAAIKRRVSEGLRLEVSTSDRLGLLSDITRLLRENGLSVTRADVTTQGEKAVNIFYVSDASGGPINMKTIEEMCKNVGQAIILHVEDMPKSVKPCTSTAFGHSLLSLRKVIKSHWERLSSTWGF